MSEIVEPFVHAIVGASPVVRHDIEAGVARGDAWIPGNLRAQLEVQPVNSGSDGLSMVVTSNGVIGRWLPCTEGHDYPLDEMHPIGTTSQGIVMLVRTDLAPDLASLMEITSPANISGSAPGSAIHWMETLTAEAFGLPINHVFGYEGQGPQVVALESNEVHILSAAKPAFE